MTAVPFDPTEPFEPGILAIEASAGTGKTYTLATLAVRALAEAGIRASELLVVTFTRAAAAELGDRIRRRIADAADHLDSPDPAATDDPVLRHLGTGTPEELAARRVRLVAALSEFDTMPISTIHSFAEQVLKALGATAGVDPDAALGGADPAAIDAACVDVLARASADPARAAHLPKLSALRSAVQTASASPRTQVIPGPEHRDAFPAATVLAELVGEVIECAAQRRRAHGTMSFDDLLTELDAALQDPRRSDVVAALRTRYRCALIDEFQDTDPVQWSIFSKLFADPATGHRLVLVGDPKQAIYSFRGADIQTYLAAVSLPGVRRRSLRVNRRSDAAVLAGIDALCAGVTFGDPAIAFVDVEAAPEHAATHLIDASSGAELPGVVLRYGTGFSGKELTKSQMVASGAGKSAVEADVVAYIRHMVEVGTIPSGETMRPVVAGDVAILTKSNDEAQSFQRACTAAGIPAVVTRGSSVLRTEAAAQWRILLGALARPTDPRRARTLAASWFGGHDAQWLVDADDAAIEAVQLQVQEWLDTLHHHGVAELVRRVVRETSVVERVLARPSGRRDVTDLDHVAEIMQVAAAERSMGIAGLLGVIDEQHAEDSGGQPDDPMARRIETDAAAVQIMTMHVSKGLEFPIVCVPSLWSPLNNKKPPSVFTDAAGERCFDVARSAQWPDTASSNERGRLAEHQALGERLRIAYVALTRARHQCVVWWLPAHNGTVATMSRLLFDRDANGAIDPSKIDTPRSASKMTVTDAVARLAGVRAALGPAVDVVEFGVAPRIRANAMPDDASAATALGVAHLGRRPDRTSHRWSFTAVTNRAAATASDPYDDSLADRGAADERLDEPVVSPVVEVIDASGGADEAPDAASDPMVLDRLPSSAAFGTLVHAVLEAADFTAPDLDTELDDAIAEAMRRRRLDITPVRGTERGTEVLRAGLRAVLATPLGPALGGLRLADLPRSERLDELAFELPLATGGPAVSERRIGQILLEELPSTDPFRGWAERLAGGLFDARLAGHLTGSIDLVLRVPDGTTHRYVVVDYKTNRLSARNEVGRLADYGPERVAAAMADHHYPLQALLYNVALHRWLRSRLTDYAPQRHLGGAAYLFVRAMVGRDTPQFADVPAGVCAWAVPASAVVRVSDALDGRDHGVGV